MNHVAELCPDDLFDLDEIEALPSFDAPDFMPDVPVFTFTEAATFDNTLCTYAVTVANENPYDGVFCFAQSPFGLEECKKCGRGVDRALRWTRNDVILRFTALGSYQQYVNCRPWKSPGLGGPIDVLRALTGWDLGAMTWGWNTMCGPGSGVACGIPKACEESVLVEGSCYWTWDVNYLLFGWMSDLCKIPDSQMISEIIPYKLVKGDPWEPPVAFARAGRDGYPYRTSTPIPKAPAKYKDCSNCGFEYGVNSRGRILTSNLGATWPHADW